MLGDILTRGGGWPLALCSFAVGALIVRFSHWVALRIALSPFRKTPLGHWVEKARLLYPGWIVLASCPLFLAMLWHLGTFYDATFIDSTTETIIRPVGALVLFGIGGFASARVEARLRERAVTFVDWLRGWGVALLLFIPHIVVFGFMAVLLASITDSQAWVTIVFATLIAAFFLCGGHLLVARLSRLMIPADDRLKRISLSASERVGVVPRRAYILRWKSVNAFAFPVWKTVAITDTAMATLSDDELIAICAHELGHINESGWVSLTRIAGGFLFLPLFAIHPIVRSFGAPGIIVAFLIFIFGLRGLQRLGRAMEVRADAMGKAHEGDPGTYARALEKIYQLNLMPVVMHQKRLLHPHLYDRLLVAEITPAYARPEPPSRWRGTVGLVSAVCLALVLGFMWRLCLRLILNY